MHPMFERPPGPFGIGPGLEPALAAESAKGQSLQSLTTRYCITLTFVHCAFARLHYLYRLHLLHRKAIMRS